MNSLEIANRYNKFQDDIGQFSQIDIDHVISTLFSESFQKIANGMQVVANRNDLKNQLLTVRDHAGKWTIVVKEVAPLQDSKRCLIRYQLHSTNLGKFDIMANLRINSKGMIEEIDEIYYQSV